ncbi:unnamed protein product [Danaus chrysippus]|uniref:(African queen) hypothetical protein n=1 Tax=Danaus chrysippus TaxID=151541 RepID=A0A8J2VTS5_9NEOP|nr:unnamed protein product [Danaus chrysippus]
MKTNQLAEKWNSSSDSRLSHCIHNFNKYDVYLLYDLERPIGTDYREMCLECPKETGSRKLNTRYACSMSTVTDQSQRPVERRGDDVTASCNGPLKVTLKEPLYNTYTRN